MITKYLLEDEFNDAEYVESDGSDLAVGALVKMQGLITTSVKNGSKEEFLCVTLKASKGKVGGTLFKDNKLYAPMQQYVGASTAGILYGKVYQKGAYKNLEIFNIAIIEETPKVEESESASEGSVSIREKFNMYIDMIEDPMLKAVVTEVYSDDNIMRKFLEAPATEKVGFAYPGGLARMVLESCKVASSLLAYNDTEPVVTFDKNIVLAATLLTNVGRAYIYETVNGVVQKNKYGILDDDTNITRDMIRNIVRKILVDAEREERVRSQDTINELIHCVDSSKKYWNEAGMSPRTKSAMICASIQSIANTIGTFEKLEGLSLATKESIVQSYTGGPKYYIP